MSIDLPNVMAIYAIINPVNGRCYIGSINGETPMLEVDDVLTAVGSTATADFNDLCRGLGANLPQERAEWADLFRTIEQAEREGLVEVDRDDVSGKQRIATVILTPAGADRVRAKLDANRGLLGLMG